MKEKIKETHERIEIEIPTAMMPHTRLRLISPSCIGPGEWPEKVYAGGLLAGFDDRVRWLETRKE